MHRFQEAVDEYNSRRTDRVIAGLEPLLLIVLGILLGICALTYPQFLTF